MARFSVVTETAYNGNDGGIVVDCTWFSVSAVASAKIRCLDQLAKGKVVKVSGRARVQRYTDGNGAERSLRSVVSQVIADEPFIKHPSADPLKKHQACGFCFCISFILSELQTTLPQTPVSS